MVSIENRPDIATAIAIVVLLRYTLFSKIVSLVFTQLVLISPKPRNGTERLRPRLMSKIYGKNHLDVLNAPLDEIYTLRLSQRDKLPIEQVDSYLEDRPDWIAYRLLRERQPASVLALPDYVSGGSELLMSCLRQTTNSSEHIKWTVYGLVAFALLGFSKVTPSRRYVRTPQKPGDKTIPEGDRLLPEHFQEILKWMNFRQTKFLKTIQTDIQQSLESTGRRSFQQEIVSPIEKLLILALGKISIIAATEEFGFEKKEPVHDAFLNIETLLNTATGGWRPGHLIKVQNLQHYRPGYGNNFFSSCFLPLDSTDYCGWFASAFARLTEVTKDSLDGHVRLFLSISSVQHREWLFARKNTESWRVKAAHQLMMSLDHAFINATTTQHLVLAGGLAARFLSVGNQCGWDNVSKQRLSYAIQAKKLATLCGCVVEGEAHTRNFEFQLQHYNKKAFYKANPNYRYQYEIVAELCSETTRPEEVALVESVSKSIIDNDGALAYVADVMGCPIPSAGNIIRHSINVLDSALRVLMYHDLEKDATVRLLAIREKVFDAFVHRSLVGGIAALAQALVCADIDHKSPFFNSQNVIRYAELLVYCLERPYMADIDARAGWQNQLWSVYTALSDQAKQKLSLRSKLCIYTAVSNITAATMKSVSDWYADQLEDTLYAETNYLELSAHHASTKALLRVVPSHLLAVLTRYEKRLRSATVFVQFVLTSDARNCSILVVRRVGDHLLHRESSVDFPAEEHCRERYESWNDISANVWQHEYFSNVSGNLLPFENSPLGHRAISSLWSRVEEMASGLFESGLSDTPVHLCIAPDAAIGNIPWQLVASHLTRILPFPSVTLVHGLRWIYASAHEPGSTSESRSTFKRYHARGIHAWIAPNPTPRSNLDLRPEISQSFFEAANKNPALEDQLGLSLSVVFGHGAVDEGKPLASTQAFDGENEWGEVRNSRICILLSCYTGSGLRGGLGDYLSISHKLCRTAKAVLLPAVAVPDTATSTVAKVFHQAIAESLAGQSWTIQDVYQEALRRDPSIALFSLWGLGYEPIVWKTSAKKPSTA